MTSQDDGDGSVRLRPVTARILRSLLPRSVNLLERISRLSSQPIADEALKPGQIELYDVSTVRDPAHAQLQEDLDMVLQNMVTVESTIAADNTDFLSGTQLDQPGVAGVYTIWVASTVGDTEVSITLGGRTITNAAIATLRANSEIRENEDPNFQMLSATGGRPVININVVTAAVVRIRVKFLPAGVI